MPQTYALAIIDTGDNPHYLVAVDIIDEMLLTLSPHIKKAKRFSYDQVTAFTETHSNADFALVIVNEDPQGQIQTACLVTDPNSVKVIIQEKRPLAIAAMGLFHPPTE